MNEIWKAGSLTPIRAYRLFNFMTLQRSHGLFCENTDRSLFKKQNHEWLREWKPGSTQRPCLFFSSSLFFCFLPISSVSSTCPTEKWRVLHRRRDRLLPRATIYRYSINHFSSYREVSACDKSVNRWTSAKRNGTGQTIRFPSMKFLRTKANTLFFQLEPRNFNFKLASQRRPYSFHMSLSSVKHDGTINYRTAKSTDFERVHTIFPFSIRVGRNNANLQSCAYTMSR